MARQLRNDRPIDPALSVWLVAVAPLLNGQWHFAAKLAYNADVDTALLRDDPRMIGKALSTAAASGMTFGGYAFERRSNAYAGKSQFRTVPASLTVPSVAAALDACDADRRAVFAAVDAVFDAVAALRVAVAALNRGDR